MEQPEEPALFQLYDRKPSGPRVAQTLSGCPSLKILLDTLEVAEGMIGGTDRDQ